MRPKRVAVLILVGLTLYLTLFTWNLRTGYLDNLSGYSGLEFTGWVLKPGKWVSAKVSGFWHRYIYLVNVRADNERLQDENRDLRFEVMELRERAAAADRLESMLLFSPPPKWMKEGARVIAHRLGPAAVLETVMVDKGRISGITEDTPVLVPEGLVGRVFKVGPSTASVLLLTDPNSRISVIGQEHRSGGILTGQGPGHELKLRYVNLNAPLRQGEVLISSGLAGIFPKGLPVARVTRVDRSEISLFLTVTAEPLVELGRLEDVLMLLRDGDWRPPKEELPGSDGGS